MFRPGYYGGDIPGSDHWERYGKAFVGTRLKWELLSNPGNKFVFIEDCPNAKPPLDKLPDANAHKQHLADSRKNPFAGKSFIRIFAERNVVPEVDDDSEVVIEGNGRGITTIIQNFIHKSSLPGELVEETILTELNNIFKGDAYFSDIVCRQLPNKSWEIYLEEETKGRIPLSQSGSGLKTIILVLVYLHLLPVHLNKELSNFVFGFEELENNLHPALLRRLLSYLHNVTKTSKCICFLTTHSSVAIDLFSKTEDAQLIHVTHDGEIAKARTVRTYIDNKGILDDLDVRASDLLQSNGIIWVEGPSDRIYLNRLINIWSNGSLTEGIHYQCVFYGGRLLSHLSCAEPELVDDAISMLRVNRNAMILIDSDKRNQQARINETKKRIIEEVEKNGGISWVTKGKEIENYLPSEAVSKLLGVPGIKQVEQYDDFSEYLNKYVPGEGNAFKDKKALFAEKVSPLLTMENIKDVLDVSEKLQVICDRIKDWNA